MLTHLIFMLNTQFCWSSVFLLFSFHLSTFIAICDCYSLVVEKIVPSRVESLLILLSFFIILKNRTLAVVKSSNTRILFKLSSGSANLAIFQQVVDVLWKYQSRKLSHQFLSLPPQLWMLSHLLNRRQPQFP